MTFWIILGAYVALVVGAKVLRPKPSQAIGDFTFPLVGENGPEVFVPNQKVTEGANVATAGRRGELALHRALLPSLHDPIGPTEDDDDRWYCTCRHFDGSDCTAYESRPPMCKDSPTDVTAPTMAAR